MFNTIATKVMADELEVQPNIRSFFHGVICRHILSVHGTEAFEAVTSVYQASTRKNSLGLFKSFKKSVHIRVTKSTHNSSNNRIRKFNG